MATTTNFGWTTPDDTDLVKDGAAAIRTLGSAIDTSLVDLKGGTTGQVLSKTSNTDMDFTWVAQDDSNAIQNAIIDAKGDLIVGTAADTPARLAVGTNGYVLTADSAEASGVKWAAPAGGGKVLQVVTATSLAQTSESAGVFTDYISASITPSSASSKVLILISIYRKQTSASLGDTGTTWKVLRGATSLFEQFSYNFDLGDSNADFRDTWCQHHLDSPNTTSSTTYKVQFKRYSGTTTCGDSGAYMSNFTLMEIGA